MSVAGTHDPVLVILSVVVAVFASYTALDLAGRGRASSGKARGAWLATAALSMGGGIWAMHFVAMLAFTVPGMEASYDVGLTLASLLVAIVATGIGFGLISRASKPGFAVLLGSGLLMGIGIVTMHFMGMAAMQMQAGRSYDRLWSTAAVLIAIVASTVALWLSLRTSRVAERMAAALAMGIAVAGMHYAAITGSAFTARPDAAMHSEMPSLDQGKLAVGVAGSTFLILVLALIAATFDRRYADTQARLQEDLRSAYDRRGLLLRLGERMRVLDDPAAMMAEVAEEVGRYLALDRAGFFRVRADGGIDFDAGASWSDGHLPALQGVAPLAGYGAAVVELISSGKTLVFDDAGIGERYAAFRRNGTVACIAAPVARGARWQSGLYCHSAAVRRWSPDEVSLVEEIASLTWDSVERVEARLQLGVLNRSLEVRVREQTRDIRLITDALPVLIAFVDESQTYRFANAAYQDWVGRAPELVIGRTMLDVLGAEQMAERQEHIEQALAGVDVHFELSWPRLSGEFRMADIRYLPRRSNDTVDGFYIFASDVTERARAAELLRVLNTNLEKEVEERTRDLLAAEEQLRQSQKMEAVGQLTGGLAHDFNNLLAGISGSLELLQARINQGRLGDVDRYVTAAQGAARRAAALTHRLLAFSRRQTLAPKVIDVNRLVGDMLDLVRRTVGPAVQVEAVGLSGAWPALVDPNQLENALLNLCINARDAMPKGGRITIETANKWLDERAARVQDMPPGQYLSLCVTDTGTGMTPEVIERAFDPFFTTKPIGEGTGLGLSMTYGFARQSGGQVRIYSEVDQGTTVCLYLPRHYGELTVVEPAPELTAAPRAEQDETVLIVDDEPTVRMLVTEVLEDLGYLAIEAMDGASGLRVLESDARIDLLVTDVGLPGGMNGRQMADRARLKRPGLNVLFITGYAENAVVGHGNLEPGMQVLTKPFTMEALASRLKHMILLGKAA